MKEQIKIFRAKRGKEIERAFLFQAMLGALEIPYGLNLSGEAGKPVQVVIQYNRELLRDKLRLFKGLI